MATPRLQKRLSALKQSSKSRLAKGHERERLRPRKLFHERLEDRRLLTTGPSLVAVLPNNGVPLNANDTLNVAPKEITFRFALSNSIDTTSLATGLQVVRGGLDHKLGTTDDVPITPGFIGLGDAPREVVMRFASTLPDDVYKITLVGSGLTPLKDTSGAAFNSGADANLTFTLD